LSEVESTGVLAPINDANQLRTAKFKELMRRKIAWGTILAISLLVLIVLIAAGIALIGVAAAAVVALFGILVVFLIADGKAEDAFFDSYCETHGLTRIENPEIGELTPLLRKGDERNTKEIFHGTLAPGVEGDLVLFTYTEVYHDSKGNRNEDNYDFTLIHVEMPQIVEHMPDLRVQNQSGFKFLEGVEDKFRGKHERVTLESEAMRDRYEVFVAKEQDPIWVRRLFSPSFIVWLTEQPPNKFAFELENGHLIAYLPNHEDDVEGLEQVTSVGTFVASRLLDEIAETSSAAGRENP
jgi:hypothetical protein